jgi:peroxiredoxin Q/BCP
MGIERSTFLIGKDGRIQKIWRKVKVKGHADLVLTEVNSISEG